MPANLNRPHLWKKDIADSIDCYNNWFVQFAPLAYRTKRLETAKIVEQAFTQTSNLRVITPQILREHPSLLAVLRMSTAPPIARDRLIGLAGVKPSLIKKMEREHCLPSRMQDDVIGNQLESVVQILRELLDVDLFPWLERGVKSTQLELSRSVAVVSDRLCGAMANPIIRNAQEQRQISAVRNWLQVRGYTEVEDSVRFGGLNPGTFGFHVNTPGMLEDGVTHVNIPIDVVIMPWQRHSPGLPFLLELKSAGDFANTNKRRKEEAVKVNQLRREHGEEIEFVLMLCGYFNSGYLGYEAAESIDWVWEHRLDDLAVFGL